MLGFGVFYLFPNEAVPTFLKTAVMFWEPPQLKISSMMLKIARGMKKKEALEYRLEIALEHNPST